ncbi:MAG TPA: molybdopterin-dependent oxidoreductase [Longimicrobiales bacterium]
MQDAIDLGFPLWIRLTHLFNILFLSLLARSGIEILGGHPKLYWNDHALPGSEWARFTRKEMPKDELWTAEDEKEPYTPWLALPGRDNLGLGRYWHFVSVAGWVIVGALYITLLFATPQWRRLLPTSWDIFPRAWEAAFTYLRLEIPPHGAPFNALQQLTYAALIFLLAPLQILTGVAMSPAIAARFPWYTKLFGGRQGARSLHFLGLLAFGAFTIHHTAIVIAHGLGDELAAIVLGVSGSATAAQRTTALAIAGAAIAGIIALHVWATRSSLRAPVPMQHRLQRIFDPLQQLLLGRLTSRQRYRAADRSPFQRPNGRPPRDPTWQALAERGFDDFVLEVGGLVERPLRLTLRELRDLARAEQTTKHVCIQGWTYTAQWAGVPLRSLLEHCRPTPEARYLCFHTFDDKWERPGHGYYYSTLSIDDALKPQTILAYEMNGRPLPHEFGAPLRLRLETQLGYKMVKYVRAIELIRDYRQVGTGHGGWREDVLHYSQSAEI